MLVLSVVRSMGFLLGSRDWRMLPFLLFVCDLLLTYCCRLFDHISDVSDSNLGCFLLTYMVF
jgi:hypothetical protein